MLPTLRWIVSLFLPEPKWKYKQDNFEGMVWRWHYVGGRPTNPVAYCPHDDTAIVWREDDYRMWVLGWCETCRRGFGKFDGGMNSVRGKIQRQIERKLRVGEWKSVVDSLNEKGRV